MLSISGLYKLIGGKSISIDTRTIKKGEVYFAIKGDKIDGHIYCKEALQRGAEFCVVREKVCLEIPTKKIIRVPETLVALQELSKYHRAVLNTPIIAITGSNGKTSSKEIITYLLSKKYRVCSTKGNYNNHIGVPLTLLSLDRTHDIAIVEMGANHEGEIEFLSRLVQPNYGVITNIGYAHIKGFGDLQTIIKTKTALYRYIQKTKGKVFVNKRDSLLVEKAKRLDIEFYDYKKIEIESKDFFLKITVANEVFETKVYGSYNLKNMSLGIKVAQFFNINDRVIIKALKKFEFLDNRSQVIRFGRKILLFDAYNANKSSMQEAIDTFLEIKEFDRKIAIIGQMNELGKVSSQAHIEIIKLLKNQEISSFFIGEEFLKVKDASFGKYYPDTISFIAHFEKMLKENVKDFFLIKGSRSLALEKLLEVVKKN